MMIRYIAVRKAKGEPEFMDFHAISGSPKAVRDWAEFNDRQYGIESWAVANPVIRIAKIEIREVKDGQ